MKLAENFNQQDFDTWVEGFLPDFDRNIRKVDVPASFTNVKSINTLGESPIGVRVYVIETDADPSRRKVGLAKDSFTLLKNYGSPNAIIAYYSESASLWRISLLTSTPIWSEGRIITKLSNPKRQSYVLGSKAKVKTPHQYLISKGKVLDFNDLKSRFSLEVVNKEFYKEVSQSFTQLVGGTVANGKSKKSYEALLKLPFLKDHSQTNLEFAVRLIGRIIFCWFLREKRSTSGHSLMPKELVSFEASNTIEDYYHTILEPIFFEILNKPIKTRKESYINELFSAIPYLNGGLFSPHEDDFFNYNEGKQAVNHNMVNVPDKWLKSLFEVLETYNFTIDENTSFDEELSIDPEMLGRIFENLLAEINPETGKSARKSTGSYYTPRIIVDYMIDESLHLYLKEKTGIVEDKLRSLISYDLDDDTVNPLNDDDKNKIARALGEIKILDPACGSGAFPIGALQKIVFILQQIDQHGQLWFKKQIQNTPIELRKVIEREFNEKNFDYIRKLGIIRENIYGIDVQPIATEISRLRCFLTLVVDERIDDTLDNRGIEPLPNLDFKFVTANTLVGLPATGATVNQMGLFEDDQGIKDLKEVRDMFFTASGFERDQLKLQFVQVQNKMFQKLLSEGRRGHADLTTKLTTWDPFSHKSSSWFDPEWMFGVKSGFDVVIANPPYVTSKYGKITKEQKSLFKDQFETAYDKIDLYVLFIEKSIKLSSNLGLTTLITPWNFLGNFYSFKVRKYLLDNTRILLFNKLPPKVFDGIIVDNIISIFQKNNINSDNQIVIDDLFDRNNRKYVPQINYKNVDKNIFALPTNEVSEKILEKMQINSVTLGEIALNYIGIMTGGQKTMMASSPIFGDKSRKVLTGKDVARWKITYKGNYVNFDKSKIHSNDNEDVYLAPKKILLRKTGRYLAGSIDNEQYFSIQSLYNIVLKSDKYYEEYILALLNSKLFTYIYNHFYITNPEVFPYIKRRHLDQFPIFRADIKEQELIANIVENICINTMNDIDAGSLIKELDTMIFDLYSLDDKERVAVEGEKYD